MLRHSAPRFSYGHAKLLTLTVLLAVVYWDDLSELSSLIAAYNGTYSALAAISVTLTCLLFKSRIINRIIEIRGGRIKTGILLFASSIILYLLGSYYVAKPVLHMVSLVFFAYSYLMIRMNILVATILSPVLLTIIALSLLTVSNSVATFVSALFFSLLAISPLLFSKPGVRLKLLVVAGHVLLYSFLRAVLLTDLTLLVLAWGESLVFWLFKREALRASASSFEKQMDEGSCKICDQSENTGDFCPFCGRILVYRVSRSRLEILESTIFILFFILSQLVSIPVLVRSEQGVVLNHLKIQGAVTQALSFSSSNWLLYDKHGLEGYGQTSPENLMLREILVPKSFPERKNYTIVFELAILNPNIANGWSFPPWKVKTTQNILLKDSIPAVYYEVSSKDALLKVAVWTEKISLFIGGSLVTRTLGISVFRNYTLTTGGQNATSSDPDTAEFLKDAEEISFDTIRMLKLASSWGQIVSSTRTLLLSAGNMLLVASIIVSVAGASIFTASKNREAEIYLLELLPEDWLRVLLTIDRMAKKGVPTTGENLLREIVEKRLGESFNADKLLRILDELEALKLVGKRIRMGSKTVFLEWGLDF
jgi:hypothetical protein